MLVLLASASVVRMDILQQSHPDHASRRQNNYNDQYLLRVYSVELLLMMENGPDRNM